jgi:nucleotide-binding universal stress UspA family protein
VRTNRRRKFAPGLPGPPTPAGTLIAQPRHAPEGDLLDPAAALARRFGDSLLLLHTVEVVPPFPAADLSSAPRGWEQEVEQVAGVELARVAPGIRDTGILTETQVVFGPAATVILETARATSPRLIVVGTHGRKGAAHFFLGAWPSRWSAPASCRCWSPARTALVWLGTARVTAVGRGGDGRHPDQRGRRQPRAPEPQALARGPADVDQGDPAGDELGQCSQPAQSRVRRRRQIDAHGGDQWCLAAGRAAHADRGLGDDQDRAGGGPDDPLGDAAQEESGGASPPMRAEDRLGG